MGFLSNQTTFSAFQMGCIAAADFQHHHGVKLPAENRDLIRRSNLTFCVSLIRYSWEEKNDTIGSVFILSISIISFYHIMLNSGSFLFIDLRRAL